MRKLIGWVIMLALIVVAREFLKPLIFPAPGNNKEVSDKTLGDTEEPLKDSDVGQQVGDEEKPKDPFVPEKPLAEVEDLDGTERVATGPLAGARVYEVLPNSTVGWAGNKLGGRHNGTVIIQSSTLQVVDGRISEGSILFDMQSMKVLDTDDAKLLAEIKSPRRFGVSEYPTATFTLLSARPTQLEGILTMKGVSKKIRFPAVVTVEEDTVLINANFSLDRTQWGINGGTIVASEFIDIEFSLIFLPQKE